MIFTGASFSFQRRMVFLNGESRGGRFRSRFLRPDDDDDTAGNRKSMHFDDDNESKSVIKKERIKVLNIAYVCWPHHPFCPSYCQDLDFH